MGNNLPNNGWRVVDIPDAGTCSNLDICVFFDFLVGCNGRRLDMSDTAQFFTELKKFDNDFVTLTFYNYKVDKHRTYRVKIQNGSLGIVVSNDCYLSKEENVVRVKKVNPNSLAEKAGLMVNDYLICSTERVVKGMDVFRTLLNKYAGKEVPFWVYNSENCTIRKLNLPFPVSGERLGCEVGDGFINRIPTPKQNVKMQNWATKKDMVYTSAALPKKETVISPKQDRLYQQPSPTQNIQVSQPVNVEKRVVDNGNTVNNKVQHFKQGISSIDQNYDIIPREINQQQSPPRPVQGQQNPVHVVN